MGRQIINKTPGYIKRLNSCMTSGDATAWRRSLIGWHPPGRHVAPMNDVMQSTVW